MHKIEEEDGAEEDNGSIDNDDVTIKSVDNKDRSRGDNKS